MKAYVEPDEVAMMEKVASNLRDKLLIRTLFHLGCRVSEALGLATDDIDFTRGTVTIKHLKSRLPVSREGKLLVFAINRHRAWQIVRECAEKAGLPKLVNPETGKVHNVSPHRLRDAFAVHAIKLDDSGDGLRLLQEHLGHLSFNTTAKYRKVAGEEHRQGE